ncbi:MAG: hypothetical protein ACE5FQ_10330 [Thiogranum sp.]
MARILSDEMKSVSSKRRKKIEVRAQQLIAEEMALCGLRTPIIRHGKRCA